MPSTSRKYFPKIVIFLISKLWTSLLIRVFEAKKGTSIIHSYFYGVPYTRILHAFYIKNFVTDCMLISALLSYEQMNVITIMLQIVLSITSISIGPINLLIGKNPLKYWGLFDMLRDIHKQIINKTVKHFISFQKKYVSFEFRAIKIEFYEYNVSNKISKN